MLHHPSFLLRFIFSWSAFVNFNRRNRKCYVLLFFLLGFSISPRQICLACVETSRQSLFYLFHFPVGHMVRSEIRILGLFFKPHIPPEILPILLTPAPFQPKYTPLHIHGLKASIKSNWRILIYYYFLKTRSVTHISATLLTKFSEFSPGTKGFLFDPS